MMKKLVALFLAGFMTITICGCNQRTDVSPSAPTENANMKTTAAANQVVANKNVKGLVKPIRIKDHKEKDGHVYRFYDGDFHMTADKQGFIVSAYMDNSDTAVICKIDLYGKVAWACPFPGDVELSDIVIADNGIYVLIADTNDNGTERDTIAKVSLDGKLLYQKGIANETDGIYADTFAACNDGLILAGERDTKPINDDFVINTGIMRKYDFRGKQIWEKYYSSDIVIDDYLANGHGMYFVYETNDPVYPDSPVWEYSPGLLQTTKDGYMKFKQFPGETVSDTGAYGLSLNKEGLLSAVGIQKGSGQFYMRLRQYNYQGRLTWERNIPFGGGKWEFYGFQTAGKFLYGYADMLNKNDDTTGKYLCQFSMKGKLVNVYQLKTSEALIGWAGNRAILYESSE